MSNAVRLNSKKIKKITKHPWLLYFFIAPLFISLVFSLFKANYMIFLFKLGIFALFASSVTLIDRGLSESQKYQESIITKAPLPYKIIGAIGVALSIFLLGSIIDKAGIFQSLFVSILGGVGVVLNYGLDPREDKIPQNSGVDPELLLKNLEDAELTLKQIIKAKDKIKDYQLKDALEKAVANARKILDTIKSDPKDIRVARKFLVVYLDGIKRVLDQYNDLDSTLIDESMKERLVSLLQDARVRFEKELENLRSNDLFELDVQIDALKEQLKD